MTPRDLVVAALADHLPTGVRVVPYARSLDHVTGPVVMVRLDRVTPSTQPQAWHLYQFAILVIVGKVEPGPADDELDELLTEVLLALEAAPLPLWSQAERAVFEESYPAYQVDLTLHITKE